MRKLTRSSRKAAAVRSAGASVDLDGVTTSYDGDHPVVADASLTLAPGEVLSILGPSGCGKTTLLRSIAGLERPLRGTVTIGDRVVSDGKTWISPERRNLGMVFQDGALFPHLSVSDNVSFGLPRAERRSDRITNLLDLVGLSGLGDRLPTSLSGGQQQRVALARALAPEPSVLLLDEPFSALDAVMRVQIRAEVARIIRDVGVTAVFVTHDQDEAFVMGDRVAVMRDGHVEQIGVPDELYRNPTNPWVAHFVGEANLVAGSATAGWADTVLGQIPVTQDVAGAVDVLVRPEQIKLMPGADGVIETVEYYGHDSRYDVRLADGSSVAVRDTPTEPRQRGDRVALSYVGARASVWVVSAVRSAH